MTTLWQELTGPWQPAILLMLSAHLIVAGVLILARPTDRSANLMLGLLLFTIAGIVFRQVLLLTAMFEQSAGWAFLPIANDLALAPLILGYVCLITSGRLPLPRTLLFTPPVVYILYMISVLAMPEAFRQSWLRGAHTQYAIPFMTSISLPATVVAVVYCWKRIRDYRNWLATHSSAKADFEIRGLHLAFLTIAAPVAGWIIASLRMLASGPASPETEYPFYLLLALCGYILALVGVSQPGIEFPKMPKPDATAPTVRPSPTVREAGASASLAAPKTALSKPNLRTAEQLAVVSESIRVKVIENGWHAEPRLALADVALRCGLSETEVSRALNQGLQTNFNRFINEIRVAEVKRSLEAGHNDILGLALDSGFNSKATFNRVFKEITGVTPSAYRSSHHATASTASTNTS